MTKPVRVKIVGDASGLETTLRKSGGALEGFGKTALGVFGGNLLTKGFDLAIGGVQALGNFALDGIGKLDAMGDAVARLDAMAAGLGQTATAVDLTKWGVDSGEAADSALAFAKVAQSLGITGEETKAALPSVQKMAAQLASLGDGNVAGQADLLAKAMAGNAKAAKALGVTLPKGVTGLAALEAITAQLAPQLDEATSGTASLADVGDRWGAVTANLQLQLAGFLESLAPVATQLLDFLVPAMTQLANVVGPALSAVMQSLAGTFSGFLEGGGASGVAKVLGTIADVAGRLGSFLLENVVPVIVDLAGAIIEALQPALEAIGPLWEAWMPVLETVWGFIEATVVPVLRDWVIPFLGKLLEVVIKIATAFGRALGPALEKIGAGFRKLLDWARPVIDALSTIARLGGDAIGAIGGAIGLRSVEPGAGSAVAARGGSPVVNVYAGVGDPVAIGREVSRVLGAYTVRAGHA
jgi:hypothetical protein